MRLRVREWVDIILILRCLTGCTRRAISLAVIVFSRCHAKGVGVVDFNIRFSRHPIGDDRINVMHGVVEPTSSVLFCGVASVAETDVAHVTILQATVSFAATRIAMNKVLENKPDVIWDRAMIPATTVSLCAVSFELILVAELFVRRSNSSVVSFPVFARWCW